MNANAVAAIVCVAMLALTGFIAWLTLHVGFKSPARPEGAAVRKPWEQTWMRSDWTADREGYDCIDVEEKGDSDEGDFIAHVHDLRSRTREETETLASFLTAAPDVYRSLSEMLDASKDGMRPNAAMIRRAIDALRKARGEAP